jgi:plasmid stabilization system protein ParE
VTFRVFYTDAFRAHIAAHVEYLRGQYVSGDIVERWYARLFSQLDELATWPKMHPVDERLTTDLGQEVRKFVYARYIITYHVDEAHHRVMLLAMVHGARRT